MSRDGVVRDFADSDCSNHLGSCTIAITADGRFVIPAQSLRAAQYPGMLMPSGSGSADVVDLDYSSTLQGLMTRSMERELLEETGLEPYRSDLVETKLLGYARLWERGGKPDFFGISLLKVPFYAVSSNTMTALRVDLPRVSSAPFELPRLMATLADLREGSRGLISSSLFLNLLLFEDYLASHGEEFLAWLGAFEAETAAEPASDLF
jgi:8-oxo-dGTP pyrophosphatase MutT (NUDIX family)